MRSSQLGFTLIEIAIVLLILGLLAGILFPISDLSRAAARDQEVRRQLQAIQSALEGYALEHGQLPCPASTTTQGEEARISTTQCETNAHLLPWRVLGTVQKDPWQRPYLYRVDKNFIKTITASTQPNESLKVFEGPNNTSDHLLAEKVAAIVISSSANAENPRETPPESHQRITAQNQDYHIRLRILADADELDDAGIWIAPLPLKNHLARHGKIQ